MTKRILLSIAGFVIFSFGLAILLNIQVALHPMDNITAMIDHITNNIILKNASFTVPFAVSLITLHSIFVIAALIMRNQLNYEYKELFLGYGGVAFCSLVLAIVQIFIPLNGKMFGDSDIANYLMFLVGFFLLSFGIYMYNVQSIFNPPIDMFFFYLKDFLEIPFSRMRTILDVSALIIASIGLLAFGSDVVPLKIPSLFMVIFLGQTFKIWALIPFINPKEASK